MTCFCFDNLVTFSITEGSQILIQNGQSFDCNNFKAKKQSKNLKTYNKISFIFWFYVDKIYLAACLTDF